jgi:hypothetical protein
VSLQIGLTLVRAPFFNICPFFSLTRYRGNFFNFINTTDPDFSGQLRFLTEELQDAEDRGLKVWIIAHGALS